MLRIFVISLCLVLASCEDKTELIDLTPGVACPTPKAYSKKTQSVLKKELKACGENCNMISEYISDYFVLRNEVRSCK